MSLETEFASQRFPQRMARSTRHACAVEHFKPAHGKHIAQALRCIACFGGAALIGFLFYLGV